MNRLTLSAAFAVTLTIALCALAGVASAAPVPGTLEQTLLALEQSAVHDPAQARRQLDGLRRSNPAMDEATRLHAEVVELLIDDALNRSEEVLARSAPLIEPLRTQGDDRLLMRLTHARAGAFYQLARMTEGWAALEEELGAARRTHNGDLIALALVDRAGFLIRGDEFEPAAASIAEAEARAQDGQTRAEVAFVSANLDRAIADWPHALAASAIALERFTAMGDQTGQADSLVLRGEALLNLQRFEECVEPLSRAEDIFRTQSDRIGVARSLRLRALVLLGMNQPESALRTSEQALSFMQEGDDPLLTARIQVEQARLEIALHHAAAAIRALEAARTTALGSPDLRLRSLYYEQDAATLAALGRFREAYGELEHHHDAEAHLTAQLVAHQLSAQRGRLESQRLAHENALLRSEADTSARALVQAQRAAQLKSIALVMGALTIALALVGYLRQRTLMQRIKRLAQTDALTGTLSRGHLLELGQRILERSRRDHRSCALLMLDVDRFKEINDVHGHAAGDRALTSVARALQSSLRPGDQIGRYGGEEFAILLPGADEREAGVIAERLRQAVMALTPDWARGAKALTISGGIALAADVDEDFHQLLDRADRALYRAKDAGRNRMEYHGPEDRTRPLDTAMAAAAASFSAA